MKVRMALVRLVVALALLVAGMLMLAGSALAADGQSTLTAEQEARAQSIDAKLIAPCCWTQTVAVHESDAAAQIRAEVRMLVAQGKGENEILDTFTQQYGEKILASPRMKGFGSLLYLIPLIVVVAAAGIVAWLMIRWRRPASATTPAVVTSAGSSRGTDEELQARLEEELSRFDR